MDNRHESDRAPDRRMLPAKARAQSRWAAHVVATFFVCLTTGAVATAALAQSSLPASSASLPPSEPPAQAAQAASTPAASSLFVPEGAKPGDPNAALKMRDAFAHEVTRRLDVPDADQRFYAGQLQGALAAHNLGSLAGEYVVLVDRNENVQALFIYYRALPVEGWQLLGASPVATGLPGQYDHFVTPLGVFEHTPANMDFRAEGTMNENGVRGYGQRDMRIFDFGWAEAERGWGKGGTSQMRFQMHATDPDRLEPLLGVRHSKGCVRIPASLNAFLDHYGILDAEYEATVEAGKPLWVLHGDRVITPWAGRYLVVVDSERKVRPAWSPLPGPKAGANLPPGGDTAD
ncbi:L,D-transpeptidase [Paraburkholderia kururiensis]